VTRLYCAADRAIDAITALKDDPHSAMEVVLHTVASIDWHRRSVPRDEGVVLLIREVVRRLRLIDEHCVAEHG
jgi:hypothetical protein